ncbi:metal ABC transporter substrate-binding protein [Butyricicoccus sp. Marseille-Q5471]|uniref:metal ABC transporter substrate-binding protein n=1 Tax=Butyricicoccus sp. Marseille-Q5471 TaxID=3039493 RepID=UPI0024BCD245|nr:metal ABC transporter substrate-binding protein [Butyricicoccus sp. Marseille-Q5471]
MKRTLSMLLASLLTAGLLSGCGTAGTQSTADAADKLSIVTTIFPQYDFTRQIVGDHAEVTMLLKPGAESHSFDPTPQDIKKIQNADLFIYTGGENDVWVDGILSSMGESQPETLKLLDCVPTVTEELVEGMEQAHEEDEAHEEEEEVDEHVWTSPQNAMRIVDKIAAVLSEKDAANAADYQANSAAYVEKLRGLDESFRDVVTSGARKTVLFGDRFPFRYLADAYGLKYYAAFSGCSTESEADAATVAFLVDEVKKDQLPVVFTIEFSNGRIADSIADATGAKKLILHSCHNVSAEDMADGATYLSLMEQNVENLREALN